MAKEKLQREPAEKASKEVTVEVPQGEFAISFYANTFGIESLDANKLVHFGLVLPGERILASWACVLDARQLETNKTNWLKYLSEIDYPDRQTDYAFRCEPGSLAGGVPFSNLMTVSRTGDVAEYRFFAYLMGDVLDDRRTFKKGKVKGEAVAVVRSSLELQRQFIVAVYGDLLP